MTEPVRLTGEHTVQEDEFGRATITSIATGESIHVDIADKPTIAGFLLMRG